MRLTNLKASQKFVDSLIDMKPRQFSGQDWNPPTGYHISTMFGHISTSRLVKMAIHEEHAVGVNESLRLFPMLERVCIKNVQRDFNLVSIKSILQSSMISKVVIRSYADFFRFSKELDCQQMLKKFELKIRLVASHVDGLETFELIREKSQGMTLMLHEQNHWQALHAHDEVEDIIMVCTLRDFKSQNDKIKVCYVDGDSCMESSFKGLKFLERLSIGTSDRKISKRAIQKLLSTARSLIHYQ
ncbi:unnamed protein product [Ambrosiozyma monospora]|uniref:Unnamed protein product n=1 Tax=Ambrosiozyma monospora TaxID=43982 RepID=A0ACB5TJS8_AMBMO|nr:unnamed protein product [Ambrosiozyma monospora]